MDKRTDGQVNLQDSFIGSLPFCVGNDHKIFVNGLAPNQIFHAIPSSLFSAAAELAALKHPRRPTQSGALEERFGKAKSSMVASSIPEYFLMMYKTCFTHTKWKRTLLFNLENIRNGLFPS